MKRFYYVFEHTCLEAEDKSLPLFCMYPIDRTTLVHVFTYSNISYRDCLELDISY